MAPAAGTPRERDAGDAGAVVLGAIVLGAIVLVLNLAVYGLVWWKKRRAKAESA